MTNMKLKRSHWRNSWNTPAVISRHVPRLYILVSVIRVTWYGGWKRTHNDATALYHARLDGDPTIYLIHIKRKRRKRETHMFKTAAVAAVVPNKRKRGLKPSDERALIMRRCCWTRSVCLLMKQYK